MNRDVLNNVIARLLSVVLMFAATVLVARALGPEGQGRYFVALTFGTLVVQLMNMGLASSNVFFLSKDSNLLVPLIANSVWLSLLLGGGIGAMTLVGLQWSGFDLGIDALCLWLGVAMTAPRMFFMLGTYLLVGLHRIGEVNLLQVASNLLVLVFLAVGIAAGAEATGLLLLNWVAWLITATLLLVCLMWHAAHRQVVPLPNAAVGSDGRFDRPPAATRSRSLFNRIPKSFSAYRFRLQIFREGIHYSIKAYLCCLLAFVVLRINVFLLQGSRGEAEVGIYSVAVHAADVLIIVPTSLALMLLPRFVQNQDRAWCLLWRSLAETTVFMLVACLAAAWLVTPAIQFAFGTAYLAASPMLAWMLPGVFFLGLSSIVSQYLAANGIPKRSIGIWGVAVLLQCGLGLWLIPIYGGVAAAATFSVVYVVNFALQLALACSIARRRLLVTTQVTIQTKSTTISSNAAA